LSKIKMLKSLDFTQRSIVYHYRIISKYKNYLVKERFWGLMLSPLMVVTIVIIYHHVFGRTESVWDFFSRHYLLYIFGFVVSIVVSLLLYQKLHFKPVRKIQDDLNDLEDLEDEKYS